MIAKKPLTQYRRKSQEGPLITKEIDPIYVPIGRRESVGEELFVHIGMKTSN